MSIRPAADELIHKDDRRAVRTVRARPASLRLTPREVEVLQRTWDGLTVKEIALEMGLSAKWVKNIRLRLGEKMHAGNAVQLVRAGLERGLLVV